MLVHHADTHFRRHQRGGDPRLDTIDEYGPRLRRQEAGKHAHERGLAGPVLAKQGVNLAPPQIEIDVLVGDNAAELHSDTRHADNRRLQFIVVARRTHLTLDVSSGTSNEPDLMAAILSWTSFWTAGSMFLSRPWKSASCTDPLATP